MPLLPLGDSLYSASILKSLNFSFDMRLLAGGVLVMAPCSTAQPIGLSLFCTPHASIDEPSNSATGLPKVCCALASHAGQVGGLMPVTLIASVPTVPVSLPPAALNVAVCGGPSTPSVKVSVSPVILRSLTGTGLPPRLRNSALGVPPSFLTSSQ